MDIPEESRQVVSCDRRVAQQHHRGGGKQRGKTTTLMTLLCSAATDVQPGAGDVFLHRRGDHGPIGSLPHVTDIVSPKDVRVSNAS